MCVLRILLKNQNFRNGTVNLGAAYGDLGDAKQAKELFERALIIKERHYGKENNLVDVYLSDVRDKTASAS